MSAAALNLKQFLLWAAAVVWAAAAVVWTAGAAAAVVLAALTACLGTASAPVHVAV